MKKFKSIKSASKLLSYILRHAPDSIGLTLDNYGWASTNELITKINSTHGYNVTLDILKKVVENNDKKRFSFSPDFMRIKANQGHSISIEFDLEPTEPPDVLYHGTATRNLDGIFADGINAGKRHHVHLSDTTDTARQVGARHGNPVVLEIDSKSMYEDGFEFMLSENGVWLVDHIPSEYIRTTLS